MFLAENVTFSHPFRTDIQIFASGLYYNQTSLLFSGTTFYKNVTFVASTSGQYMICGSAMDTVGLTSPLYCYAVTVGISQPSVNQSTMSPIGSISIVPTIPVNFTCRFNVPIKRSTTTAAITLFDASTNTQVAAVTAKNTSYVWVVNSALVFNFGTTLVVGKSYYITLAAGK